MSMCNDVVYIIVFKFRTTLSFLHGLTKNCPSSVQRIKYKMIFQNLKIFKRQIIIIMYLSHQCFRRMSSRHEDVSIR